MAAAGPASGASAAMLIGGVALSRTCCCCCCCCVVQVWDLVPGALQEALGELVGEKDDDAVPEADVSADWGTNCKQALHDISQPKHSGLLCGPVGLLDHSLLQPGAKHTH